MKIIPAGHALSLFLLATFTSCVLCGLARAVNMHMRLAWEPTTPGFRWNSFPAFLIGLARAYAYGWYTALVFVPLYNFFIRRGGAA